MRILTWIETIPRRIVHCVEADDRDRHGSVSHKNIRRPLRFKKALLVLCLYTEQLGRLPDDR